MFIMIRVGFNGHQLANKCIVKMTEYALGSTFAKAFYCVLVTPGQVSEVIGLGGQKPK